MAKHDPWAGLKLIRQSFLSEKPIPIDYWSDAEVLDLYDRSLGARIGWKWDAVMAELNSRGHRPIDGLQVLDWGCGTGVAARAWVSAFQASKSLFLYDRSQKAQNFALQKVQEILASKEISTDLSTGLPEGNPDLILVSHVLTELEPAILSTLKKRLGYARSFVWVEPGTMKIGRLLPEIRDEFLKQGWEVLGPCPHQAKPCGLRREGREKDWCHNFASTPNHAHQDPFWSEARNELMIDLRRTPYTYLAMQKKSAPAFETTTHEGDGQLTRILGEARQYKGYAKLLLCREVVGSPAAERNRTEPAPDDRQGEVDEFTLQKRDSRALLKQLKKGLESPLLRFEFGPNQKIKEPESVRVARDANEATSETTEDTGD